MNPHIPSYHVASLSICASGTVSILLWLLHYYIAISQLGHYRSHHATCFYLSFLTLRTNLAEKRKYWIRMRQTTTSSQVYYYPSPSRKNNKGLLHRHHHHYPHLPLYFLKSTDLFWAFFLCFDDASCRREHLIKLHSIYSLIVFCLIHATWKAEVKNNLTKSHKTTQRQQ